jgi:hypothetical protein
MRLFRSFAIVAAVTLAVTSSALAQGANALTGVWQGAFWGGNQQTTVFTATLNDEPGPGFSGSIVEGNVFGERGTPFLLSTVTGRTNGDVVSFSKTYDGTAGATHTVRYEGRMQSSRRITGTWTIDGNSGNFELAR